MSKKQYSGSSKSTGDYGYKSENLPRNKSKRASNEAKEHRSARVGMIFAFIQLFISVAFIGLLLYKRFAFISMPVLAGIVALLIILFGFALFMQQKDMKVKRTGKVISIFTIIILLLGSYIIYPLNPMSGKRLSLDPFVVFVSATDTFGGLGENSNQRSDTNILAVVNPKTYTVLMVSTPRDYYVPIQAEGVAPASYDKLTHVGLYGNGVAVDSEGNEVSISDWMWASEVRWQPGYNALMDTLKYLYNFEIASENYHYVRLNFTGFADLIDALGGITVDVDVPFSTKTYATYGDVDNGERKTYTFEKGIQDMDGDEALTFARERKSFASGDIQRNKNQVKVLNAMSDKLLSGTTLLRYTSIVNAIEDSFTTDMDISSLVSLQTQIAGKSDYNGWQIMSYSVSGDSSREVCTWGGSSLSVVLQDEESVSNASTLINMALDGTDAETLKAQIKTFQGE